MKSQVNALLHVTKGLCKDVLSSYPAMKESLSKDMERIALYSQERGIGFHTLDLPHLESLLLKGLECGRLVLEGPLSQRVSSKTQVPKLFSGLWLRVFERDSSLKQDVDVTALFFLRQLLVLGKKLELGCTHDRTQAIVRAYHDIERGLSRPSLGWAADTLTNEQHSEERSDADRDGQYSLFSADDYQYCDYRSGDSYCLSVLLRLVPQTGANEEVTKSSASMVNLVSRLETLHLVQALDGTVESLSLFREECKDRALQLRRQDLLNRIQQVADLIVGSFDTLDPVAYSGSLEESGKGIGFKHGPGAVAERLKNWEKSQFPNWPHKLQNYFPFEKCGTTATSGMEKPLNHERSSRLIAVPKTSKGPRLIAAEPVAHQWCQQLILRFLFDQCKKHFRGSFIDFKDQSKSGDLVLAASLNGSLATVDLSDASDRLTCWTVERMFRRNPSLLLALHAARTRSLRDDISEVKGFLKLKKFASQGTATTFPVMSLVMLFIALGSTLKGEISLESIRKCRTQVRVFGDDIILPTHGYVRLVEAMELLELKVNVAKSYTHGQFRESCGVDGFQGYDVTPVKPKTLVADSPASCQAVVDITNNLFMKGLWHASDSCLSLLPARVQRGLRIVGRNDAGFRGITSYSGSDERHLTRRWNSRLHRYDVRVWSILGQSRKIPRDGISVFLDFIVREHSSEHARTVSEYTDIRNTRDGVHWEPENTDARLHDRDTL